MKPLIHDSTQNAIDNFIESPSHALLLSGPTGSGKSTIAQYIAGALLNIPSQKVVENQFIRIIQKTDKSVTIESIRSAQSFTQLKIPGKQKIRRIIIVQDGETMSTEAQNAFLKLLEEPPADTVIIVTTNSTEKILPTIRSRTQHIQIQALSLHKITKYFEHAYSDSAIQKAYFISEGYMGLFCSILTNDTTHSLVEQIMVAKKVLGGTIYERLIEVDAIVKQKNIPLFLQAMERVCHASLVKAIEQDSAVVDRWTSRLKTVVTAESNVQYNPQPKLLLTHLMLNL